MSIIPTQTICKYTTATEKFIFEKTKNLIYAKRFDSKNRITIYPIDYSELISSLPEEIQQATADKVIKYLLTNQFLPICQQGKVSFSKENVVESVQLKDQSPPTLSFPLPLPSIKNKPPSDFVMTLNKNLIPKPDQPSKSNHLPPLLWVLPPPLHSQQDPQVHYVRAIEFLEKKQYSEAIAFFHQALDVLLKQPDEIFIANIYEHLGVAYHMISKIELSIHYSQKSLDLKLQRLGENHIELASNYAILGANYVALKDFKNALGFYSNELVALTAYHGKTHIQVIACFEHIGYIYEELEQFENALACYQQALQIKESLFDPNTLTIAQSYENLAQIYCLLQNYPETFKYFLKAINIQRSLLGIAHRSIALNYNHIGFSYYRDKQYDAAIKYYYSSLVTWLRLDPSTYLYEELQNTVENIITCAEMGNYKEELKKCANACESILGRAHPLTQSLHRVSSN